MIGKTLGHYKVIDLLGKGGMGEVYRAQDTKLGRTVALKLLPAEIAADEERLARFRREARVLASLNHTNIASIHGLEEEDGQLFLILELAEGEDLSERMLRGSMSPDEAIAFAQQLAEGLEQAHERGVVHRDLKPANIKLASDGTVKILDFGLARAYAGESAEEGNIGMSPTITAAMTQAGTILGTAAYMSPEQARGIEVDRRADIWAFGVILYEVLTGTRLFEGETISDTLAEVLKTDPDLDALPEDTPVALRWLIDRCLQKRPSKRLRDIGEARILFESNLDQLPATAISAPGLVLFERPRWVFPVLAAIGLLALAGGFGLAHILQSEPDVKAIHAAMQPPAGQSLVLGGGGHIAMSPDGSRVAFVARDSSGTVQVWVRRLDSTAPYLLSGTVGASYPFWSPDGSKVAFFAGGKLRKIDAGGGVATAICDAPNGRGGAWNIDDRILFAFEIRDHIQIVSATGGEPMSVTTMDTLHFSHRWPAVMPDGKHFVYMRAGDVDELRWRPLESAGEERVLLSDVTRASFADGNLFFGRDNALWARPFDPVAGEFLGEEGLVAESLVTSANFVSSVYSVARDGTLVYASGGGDEASMIGLFDGEGIEVGRFDFGSSYGEDPCLSPDGRFLAISLYPSEGASQPDIWIRDLRRDTQSRFTNNEAADDPVWSPAGDRIIYSDGSSLKLRSTQGARDLLLSIELTGDPIPHDWSSDGKFVLYSADAASRAIWILPVDDPESRYPVVENGYFSSHATFSPDGKWVAYMSLSNGQPQVFLHELSANGGTWQVSPGFGIQPRWRGDGSELFYIVEAGIDAVPVSFTQNGPEFGTDRRVLTANILGGRSNTHRYDMADDASLFVVQIDSRARIDDVASLDLMVGWRSIVGVD